MFLYTKSLVTLLNCLDLYTSSYLPTSRVYGWPLSLRWVLEHRELSLDMPLHYNSVQRNISLNYHMLIDFNTI